VKERNYVVAKAMNRSKDARQRKPKTMEESVRYAVGHKVRVELLMALNDGVMTLAELADEVGWEPNALKHHVRQLLEDGSIEVAHEERRGNMVIYWYKPAEIPVYSKKEAEAMTAGQRLSTVGAILLRGIAELLGALEARTLADPNSILYWARYEVDREGEAKIDKLTHKFLEDVREAEVESTNRRAKTRADSRSILVTVAVCERARRHAAAQGEQRVGP
jgi:predicted ArsR family transcriptional regulator